MALIAPSEETTLDESMQSLVAKAIAARQAGATGIATLTSADKSNSQSKEPEMQSETHPRAKQTSKKPTPDPKSLVLCELPVPTREHSPSHPKLSSIEPAPLPPVPKDGKRLRVSSKQNLLSHKVPCPLCLATPFHFRYRCPVILAGP